MIAQIVLFDGFDPLDVIAPFEVLTSGGVSVELVSAEGARVVPSGLDQVTLTATDVLGHADLVVVPGAAGPVPDIPAILGRAATGLSALLKEALEHTTVATVCGGSLLLAMAGLITGRPATTHHLGMEALAASGVQAVDARIVDDGDLITAAGVTSGLDLGLYLLERFVDAKTAHNTGKFFAHERRGTVWAA